MFKTKFPQYLKTHVFNQYVRPTLTYDGHEDGTKHAGSRPRDRKSIEWIRQKTKLTDIAKHVARLKWK